VGASKSQDTSRDTPPNSRPPDFLFGTELGRLECFALIFAMDAWYIRHRTISFGPAPAAGIWKELLMITAARASIFSLMAAAVMLSVAPAAFAQSVGLSGSCDDKNSGPFLKAAADKMVVRSGEAVTLTASTNDNSPVFYMWRADTGRIYGTGASVRFDTTGLGPGRYDVVLMGRSDRCGVARLVTTIEVQGCPELQLTADSLSVTAGQSVELSATGYSANTVYNWTVNVTKLEPLPPSTLLFNTNDSRLDNADKAQLDDTSLRAQQDPNAKVLVYGTSTKGAKSGLAKRRAERTRDYLVNEKNIDPARVELRFKDNADQDSVQVIIVPAGADMPQD
jgi:hypothetical protein